MDANLKLNEKYEKQVEELVELIKQEAIIGVLSSTLDVLLDEREIFRTDDPIKDLIDYLKDDIYYATEA